jgi:hypothetical protein
LRKWISIAFQAARILSTVGYRNETIGNVTIAALHEPLATTNDGYVRSRLKQAITSANVYYSSCKWGITEPSKRQKPIDRGPKAVA